MMNSGDWTIPYLVKAVWGICILLVFGGILNVVILGKDRLLLERDHQTSLRISLLRAEHDRKFGDLQEKYKRTCEQSVQEAVRKLKVTAQEQQRNATLLIHSYYSNILKNNSIVIKQLTEDLDGFTRDVKGESKKSTVMNILARLQAVKLDIPDISLMNEITGDPEKYVRSDGIG